MAEIHGTIDKLCLHTMTKSERKQEEAKLIANHHRSKFKFSELGIPIGA